jgi:hypothetical protein
MSSNSRVEQCAAALTQFEGTLSKTSTFCRPPLRYSPLDCSNAMLGGACIYLRLGTGI